MIFPSGNVLAGNNLHVILILDKDNSVVSKTQGSGGRGLRIIGGHAFNELTVLQLQSLITRNISVIVTLLSCTQSGQLIVAVGLGAVLEQTLGDHARSDGCIGVNFVNLSTVNFGNVDVLLRSAVREVQVGQDDITLVSAIVLSHSLVNKDNVVCGHIASSLVCIEDKAVCNVEVELVIHLDLVGVGVGFSVSDLVPSTVNGNFLGVLLVAKLTGLDGSSLAGNNVSLHNGSIAVSGVVTLGHNNIVVLSSILV